MTFKHYSYKHNPSYRNNRHSTLNKKILDNSGLTSDYLNYFSKTVIAALTRHYIALDLFIYLECTKLQLISVCRMVNRICQHASLFSVLMHKHDFVLFVGQQIRKLVKDGLIIKKPVAVHSRSRCRKNTLARRKGRHTGVGMLTQMPFVIFFFPTIIKTVNHLRG